MKKALIFGVALTLVAGFTSLTTAADKEKKDKDPKKNGAEILKVTNGTDAGNPAYFPHWAHQEREKDREGCGTCHHGKNEDGTQAEYKKGKTEHKQCHECHNKDGITLDGKISGVPLPLTSPIQRAGHGRCAGCHNQQENKTSSTGKKLMMCATCHNDYKTQYEEVNKK